MNCVPQPTGLTGRTAAASRPEPVCHRHQLARGCVVGDWWVGGSIQRVGHRGRSDIIEIAIDIGATEEVWLEPQKRRRVLDRLVGLLTGIIKTGSQVTGDLDDPVGLAGDSCVDDLAQQSVQVLALGGLQFLTKLFEDFSGAVPS